MSPSERDLERFFGAMKIDPFKDVERSFNAAPTMLLPVVRMRDGELAGALMQWGLIPYWWNREDLPSSTINARVEDAAVKPMWRDAVSRTRALVPALGWYEWKAGTTKVPHYIRAPHDEPICFAALWSRWRPKSGEPLLTFAILTTNAAQSLAEIHPRMPAVLPKSAWESWLDPQRTNGTEVMEWLVTATKADFHSYPVSTFVNSPHNQGEKCIEPVSAQRQLDIAQ